MADMKPDQAILDSLMARAAVDREFRARLLTDPYGAIEELLGRPAPRGFRVRFIEKDPDLDALFVLPDLAGEPKLSIDELDAVAGGTDNCWAATSGDSE